MPEVYTIPLSKIIHELQLETAFLPKSADDILIQSRDVVRPGMELNGYHEYFDPNRIAVLGRAEMYMLESLKPERRAYGAGQLPVPEAAGSDCCPRY